MISQEIKEQVITLLSDASADNRRCAAIGLMEHRSAMVASALSMALQDTDKGVRDSAARSLLSLKCKSAAYAVAEYLTDNSFITRNLAASLLLQFGSDAVDPLLDYAVHENQDVRKMAVDTLGLIGDSKAVPVLISLLNDSDSNVILAAIEALGNIKDTSAAAPIAVAFISYDFARVVAAEALGKIGDESVSPFFISLLQNRTNPQGEEVLVTFAIVEALASTGCANCLENIVPLIHNTSGKLQRILLFALVCIAERHGISLAHYSGFAEKFVEALSDDDLRIVIASAKALIAMPSDETEQHLLNILGKSEALDQLILSNLRNNGRSFVKIVQKYPALSDEQKKTALEFLLPNLPEIAAHSETEVQQSRTSLFSLLTEEWVDANEEMRGLIVDALFYLNDEGAIRYFSTLLGDTYQWLRMRVLELIAQATHFRSSEVLARFVNDDDTMVREFVNSILQSRGMSSEEAIPESDV